MLLYCLNSILEKHCICYRTCAARDRSDGRHSCDGRVVVDIAGHLAVYDRSTEVEHGSTFSDHVAGDKAWLADRRGEDFGLSYDARQVAGARVCDGDSSVTRQK